MTEKGWGDWKVIREGDRGVGKRGMLVGENFWTLRPPESGIVEGPTVCAGRSDA